MQKLITKEVAAKMPALYSQEKVEDPEVIAKFFTPWTSWTWYATEASVVRYDINDDEVHHPLSEYEEGDEVLFFGLVDGLEKELGYWTLEQLTEVFGPAGLRIERDAHYSGHKLSEVA